MHLSDVLDNQRRRCLMLDPEITITCVTSKCFLSKENDTASKEIHCENRRPPPSFTSEITLRGIVARRIEENSCRLDTGAVRVAPPAIGVTREEACTQHDVEMKNYPPLAATKKAHMLFGCRKSITGDDTTVGGSSRSAKRILPTR